MNLDTPHRAQGPCPYRGIHPFHYGDRELFFGRSDETEDLLVKVVLGRLIVLFGQSGTGKSSLINAGLVPRLLDKQYAVERLRVHPDGPILVEGIRSGGPGSAFLPSAFASLDASHEPAAPGGARLLPSHPISETDPARQQPRSTEFMATEQAPRALTVEQFHERVRAVPGRRVLIFDQFEELFTLFPESQAASRQGILDLLTRLARDLELKVKILLIIREDFLAHLEVFARDYPEVFEHRVRLQKLDAASARQAILAPFEAEPELRPRLAPELAEELILQLQTESGDGLIQPTQLQIVCARLWLHGAGKQESVGLADFKDVQGLAGLLEGFLDGELDDLGPQLRDQAMLVLGNLLTKEGTRDIVSLERLTKAPGLERLEKQQLVETLDALERHRLINKTANRGTFYYDIASEYLAQPILRDRREREIAAAARLEREQAEARTRSEWERAEAQARAARRRAWVVGALTLLLLLAGWQYVEARRQRDEARRQGQIASSNAAIAATNETRWREAAARAASNASNAAANERRWQEAAARAATNAAIAATNEARWQEAAARAETNATIAAANENKAREAANELGAVNTVLQWERRSLAETRQQRTADLFESFLNYGVLLARNSQYLDAQEALGYSRDIEWDPGTTNWVVDATLLHSRNLLEAWVQLSGAAATATNPLHRLAPVPVRDLAVAPDGKGLVAVGEEGAVALFTAVGSPASPPRFLRGHLGTVNKVVFQPGGQVFLTAGEDRRVLRWSYPDGGPLPDRWQDAGPVRALAASPDGRLIASAGRGPGVSLRGADGTTKLLLGTPTDQINDLAFSQRGTLAAACDSGYALLWRLPADPMGKRSRLEPPEVFGPYPEPLLSVSFAAAGDEILLTGSEEGGIQIWPTTSPASPTPRSVLRGHRGRVLDLALAGADDWLLSAGWDQTVRLWSLRDSVIVRVLLGHVGPVTGLDVSAGVAFSGSTDGTWRTWPLESKVDPPWRRVIDTEAVGLGPHPPTCCALAPDASAVALGMANGEIHCLKLPEGTAQLWSASQPPPHDNAVSRIAFSPDGSQLASAGRDGLLKLWRARDGRFIETLWTNGTAINAVAFSADRRWLAFAAQGAEVRVTGPSTLVQTNAGVVGLFDLEHRSWRFARVHEHEALSVAFDERGQRLATAGPTNVAVFDTDAFPEGPRWNLPVRQAAWAALSGDGHRVAAVGRAGKVQLFDLDPVTSTAPEAGPISGQHDNTVVRVAFSPDDGHLFTLGADLTVRTWDLEEEWELFRSDLPQVRPPATQTELPDLDALGRALGSGETWISVTLPAGRLVLYNLGAVYREGTPDHGRAPDGLSAPPPPQASPGAVLANPEIRTPSSRD